MEVGFSISESFLMPDGGATVRSLLEEGFRWVELYDPRGAGDLARFKEYSRLARQIVEAYRPSMSLHLPAHDLNLASSNAGIRRESLRQVREAVAYAADMGARLLVLHAGSIGDFDLPRHYRPAYNALILESKAARAACWARALESVKEVARLAAAAGLILTLENLLAPQDLLVTADDIGHFLSLLQEDRVGLTFDVGHAFAAGQDLRQFVALLRPWIHHVHVTDNDGERDLHLPPGLGKIDWPGLVSDLVAGGYRGAVILEIVSEGLYSWRRSKAYVEELIQDTLRGEGRP